MTRLALLLAVYAATVAFAWSGVRAHDRAYPDEPPVNRVIMAATAFVPVLNIGLGAVAWMEALERTSLN